MNKKILFVLTIITIFSTTTSAAQINLDPEGPVKLNTGEAINLNGEATPNDQITYMEIKGITDSRVYCNQDSCETEAKVRSYQPKTTEYTFKARTVNGKILYKNVSVTWNLEWGTIDEIGIKALDSEEEKLGEYITVEATTSGSKIDKIAIQSKGNNQWYTDKDKTNCGQECSLQHNYRSYKVQEDQVRAKAVTESGITKTSNQITLKWKEEQSNAAPSINLKSPTGEIDDTTPSYKWKLTDDQDTAQSVEIFLDDDNNVFNSPIERKTLSQQYKDVGVDKTFSHPSYWNDLEKGQSYYWGLKVNDGENQVKAKKSFNVKGRERVDNVDPEAKLDITPRNSNIGETVTFDASGSTDNDALLRYKFDFDNDGDYDKTTYQSTVRKSFNSEYNGKAKVKVYDLAGNSDTAKDSYQVSEREEPPRDTEKPDSKLEISPSISFIGETVTFDASDSTDNEGIEKYKFDFNGDGYYERTDYDGIVTKSFNTELHRTAKVKVFDLSGNTDTASDTYKVKKKTESNDNGRLTVDVENEKGAKLDAKVTVNGQNMYTGQDGTTTFTDLPRTTHQVKISKTNYYTEYRQIDLESVRSASIQAVLQKKPVEGPEPGQCKITNSNIEFSLQDYTINKGESTQAEIRIFNPSSQDQQIQVEFKEGQNIVEQRTVTVNAENYRTVTSKVNPETDQYIRANVETTGDPCGSKSFAQKNLELIVLSGEQEEEGQLEVKTVDRDDEPVKNVEVRVEGPEDKTRFTDRYGKTAFSLSEGDYTVRVSHPDYRTQTRYIDLYEDDLEQLRFELQSKTQSDDEGTLAVNVKDRSGDWIEDAKVEVENGEDRTRYTNSYGYSQLDLEEGYYDVTVSHPDYLDEEERSVYIEGGETERETFRLHNERDDSRFDGLEIKSIRSSNSVCRGNSLSVQVTVENNENHAEYVEITGEGLGSDIETNGFIIDERESETKTLRFTNAEGSGEETIRIQARNGSIDTEIRTVDVRDCSIDEDPIVEEPSSISMKLSYPIQPNKALVGDTVKVSGFVDGTTGRSQVEINVNGRNKGKVSTQPDGYYQTYIRADSIGRKTVRAEAGDVSASRQLEVLPTASVGFVDAPQKVFEGEDYQVCSNVDSQVEAKVLLLRDDRILESTNANGEVCFDLTAEQPGKHVYEVRALTSGTGSSSTQTVTVLETDVEAKSFPDQVASVESGDGMVKVELYNTHNELKRYDIELNGLPSTWRAQSDKQVVLNRGERKTVYFYMNPREEGNFNPELVVRADNQDVFREKVDLYVGGQNEPRKKSFVEKVTGFFQL